MWAITSRSLTNPPQHVYFGMLTDSGIGQGTVGLLISAPSCLGPEGPEDAKRGVTPRPGPGIPRKHPPFPVWQSLPATAGLSGAVDQSTCTWPLPVAWASSRPGDLVGVVRVSHGSSAGERPADKTEVTWPVRAQQYHSVAFCCQEPARSPPRFGPGPRPSARKENLWTWLQTAPGLDASPRATKSWGRECGALMGLGRGSG